MGEYKNLLHEMIKNPYQSLESFRFNPGTALRA
jgi:hypothetical protein